MDDFVVVGSGRCGLGNQDKADLGGPLPTLKGRIGTRAAKVPQSTPSPREAVSPAQALHQVGTASIGAAKKGPLDLDYGRPSAHNNLSTSSYVHFSDKEINSRRE